MPISAPPDGFVANASAPPDGYQGPPDGFKDQGPSSVSDVVKSAGKSALQSLKTIGQLGLSSLPKVSGDELTLPDSLTNAAKVSTIPGKVAGAVSDAAIGALPESVQKASFPAPPLSIAGVPLYPTAEMGKVAKPVLDNAIQIGMFGGIESLMDTAMRPGIGEAVSAHPDLKVPNPEAMTDEALQSAVAKKTVSALQESALKDPETSAIQKDTESSPAVKASGVPAALVDSSPNLKGTDVAPAPKPEIVPGTRAFSWQVWDRLVPAAADAVAKQGQNGILLANDIRAVRDIPKVRFGMEFGAPFQQMYNAIPKEMEEKIGTQLSDILEGKDVPNHSVPPEMIDFTRQALGKIADESNELGVKVHRADGSVVPFAERENYFPRMMKQDILEKLIKDDHGVESEIAKNMLKTKQAPHFSAAMEQVKLMRKNLLERKFGNLERAREVDLPEAFYERNAFKVIPQYMRTAYQRLAEVKVFGLNDMKALEKIDGIAMEGKDADLALRTYRRFTGRDPVDGVAKGAFQALKNWSTGSMIKFQTTLYHLPRTVYPAFEAGYFRAMKSFVKSFGEASDLEAMRMGTNLTHAMSEYLGEDYGTGRGLSGKFANTVMEVEGIRPLDRFDRKFSAILGKDWIQNDLVKTLLETPGNKRVRTQLQSLGMDPDVIVKNKGMSELELNVGAKRFSDRTQGNPDPTTLPLWWSSPAGKMYSQFHNFIFVVSREMESVISRAARTGDMATLGRIAVGWPAVGLAVHSARSGLGFKDNQYVQDPHLNRALNIARDGIPMPIAMEVMFKLLQGKKGVQDMMIPPSIGNAVDVLGDMGDIVHHGGLTKSVKKDLERKIPIVGTILAHQQQ